MDKVMDYFKIVGVKDIYPIKARGAFAKALFLEDQEGKTTPQAQEQLDKAVDIITAAELAEKPN